MEPYISPFRGETIGGQKKAVKAQRKRFEAQFSTLLQALCRAQLVEEGCETGVTGKLGTLYGGGIVRGRKLATCDASCRAEDNISEL